MPILIASLISIIIGSLGIALSSITGILYLQGILPSFPLLGPLLEAITSSLIGSTIFIGITAIVLSLLHILAGIFLWLSLKKGGWLGIALAAADILIYAVALLFPLMVFLLVPTLITGTLMAIAIFRGWNSLH
jgi:hypothetical protein